MNFIFAFTENTLVDININIFVQNRFPLDNEWVKKYDYRALEIYDKNISYNVTGIVVTQKII